MVADRRSGYSLFEMSMVLTLVSALGVGGMTAQKMQTVQERANLTATRLALIDQALVNQAALSGALACPARIDIGPETADPALQAQFALPTDCTAAATAGVRDLLPAGGGPDDTMRYGAVPTRALGLPDSIGFDGWGRRIVYAAMRGLAQDAGGLADTSPASAATAFQVQNGGGIAAGSFATGTVTAYALISAGEDGNGAYLANGVANPCLAGRADSANCAMWQAANASPLVEAAYNPQPGAAHFDDLLRYRALDTLAAPASGTTAVIVAAGNGFTCAVESNTHVGCWGSGGSGQLGNGAAASSNVAVRAGRLSGMIAVAAGAAHACALGGDGSVWCWGDNSYGQLGDGTAVSRSVPVRVHGIGTARALALGDRHSCALVDGGAVACWGSNSSGQLGDGTGANRSSPVAVLDLTGASALAAGGSHNCAIKNGAAWCWGSNGSGELGDGTLSPRNSPVKALTLSAAASLAIGNAHSCAVDTLGVTWCWGNNAYGQLGSGLLLSLLVPTPVVTPLASAPAAGAAVSCAIQAGGAASCWGNGSYGQLASGSLLQKLLPTLVPLLIRFNAISVGTQHACGVDTMQNIWCWGNNATGATGAASSGIDGTPRLVAATYL